MAIGTSLPAWFGSGILLGNMGNCPYPYIARTEMELRLRNSNVGNDPLEIGFAHTVISPVDFH